MTTAHARPSANEGATCSPRRTARTTTSAQRAMATACGSPVGAPKSNRSRGDPSALAEGDLLWSADVLDGPPSGPVTTTMRGEPLRAAANVQSTEAVAPDWPSSNQAVKASLGVAVPGGPPRLSGLPWNRHPGVGPPAAAHVTQQPADHVDGVRAEGADHPPPPVKRSKSHP